MPTPKLTALLPLLSLLLSAVLPTPAQAQTPRQHVRQPNGEYTESTDDLRIKVLGGEAVPCEGSGLSKSHQKSPVTAFCFTRPLQYRQLCPGGSAPGSSGFGGGVASSSGISAAN